MNMTKFDKVFAWFEKNRFKDEGDYPTPLNLLFEFADWIDTDAARDVIADEFGLVRYDNEKEIERIKGLFDKDINKTLETWSLWKK